MKAKILDIEALKAVSPVSLLAFALKEGWVKSGTYGLHADLFAAPEKPEIILPKIDSVADYAALVSQLIRIFSDVVKRDELSVYRDLTTYNYDVIRLHAFIDQKNDSIPLESGVRLITHAKDMMLAAACAAHSESKKPVYRTGKNKYANEFIKKVQLGQTEKGSFIITLLSKIVEDNNEFAKTNLLFEKNERYINMFLLRSLIASKKAIKMAEDGYQFAFDEAVVAGVSANLCEALGTLIEDSKNIEINFLWSNEYPVKNDKDTIAFNETDGIVLLNAAKKFRSNDRSEYTEIFGPVEKLIRDYNQDFGNVTISAFIDRKARQVSIDFGEVDYRKCVEAHSRKRPIVVSGNLNKVGLRWHMLDAKLAEIVEEDQTEKLPQLFE